MHMYVEFLAGLLRDDDAYLGILFEYLIVQMRQDYHAFSHIIVGTILDVAGERLIAHYPAPMKKIIALILQPNGYHEQLKEYINSERFMNEPYNQPECFPADLRPEPPQVRFTPRDLRIRLVSDQVDDMRKRAQQLN